MSSKFYFISCNKSTMGTCKHLSLWSAFTLSTLDDDEIIDTATVITSIKEFLDSIGEGHNFAVISNHDIISIKSISGKEIEREGTPQTEMFACTHCGFVTRYQVELTTHMRINVKLKY